MKNAIVSTSAKEILCGSITHVVGLCSNVKVFWIEAPSVVTLMKGIQRRVLRHAEPKNRCKPICLVHLPVKSQPPVPLSRQMSCKLPASVRRDATKPQQTLDNLIFCFRCPVRLHGLVHVRTANTSLPVHIAKAKKGVFPFAALNGASRPTTRLQWVAKLLEAVVVFLTKTLPRRFSAAIGYRANHYDEVYRTHTLMQRNLFPPFLCS
jgi:hypothetical protein